MIDVSRLTYKPGWKFKIGGPGNTFLCVFARTPDSNNTATERTTQHMFKLPDPPPDHPTLMRWVFDCLLLCEQHEAGEFFQVGDIRPFYPHHADEGDPYDLVDRTELLTWP